MKKTLTICSILACFALAGCGGESATGSIAPGPLTPDQLAEIEAKDKAVYDAEMAQKSAEGERTPSPR